MAVRVGMNSLIALFRYLGNVNSNSEQFGGVTFWTNEQLQDILDASRAFQRVRITPLDVGNTIFQLQDKDFKKLDVNFSVYDSSDNLIETSRTYNLQDNHIVFAAEEVNAKFVEGYFYNLYSALADLYDRKAAHREHYVDMKSGNAKLNLQQEYEHCINRRDYYNNKTAKRVRKVRENRWVT